MITIHNKHFIAEGVPGNLGGRGRDESGGGAYEASWQIWSVEYEDENGPVKDEQFAHGFVKWDGCSNWSFHHGSCMFHSCDRERLSAIGDILAMCWDRSAELMPDTWWKD